MSCIRKFSNTVKGFVFALGFCFIFHGMMNNGIVLVNVSTIERRFHFTSTKSGIIASCYDITSCILCPLVTFFGSNSHKPRLVAVGLMIYVVACVLNSMPHFIADPYHPPNTLDTGLCSQSSNLSKVTDTGDSSVPFVLFILGSIFLGAGTVCLITLGLAYIDDNTTKGKSALYIGIIGGLSSIGSVCGFLIGGYCLSFYVNVGEDTQGLSSKDPAWVGNWWAPYLLSAAMALCAVLMLLQFPKQIKKIRVSDDEDDKACTEPNEAKFDKTLSGLVFAIKMLVKNSIMILTIVANAVDSFLLSGFSVFLPKFIQNQFQLSPTMASVLAGTVSVPGAFFGHVVSGFLVRKYRMAVPAMLKTVAVATFISGILCLSTMLHCPNPVKYGNAADDCHLDEHCRCDSSAFRPVCGNDSNVYLSPCHAGCKQQSQDTGHFHDCVCINQNFTSSGGTARSGTCDERCETVIPFLILLFFIIVLSFFTMTPSMMVVMRCVSPAQKSFAVGLYWLVNRLLGSIPGPLIFGKVFDASCTIWMKRDNGGQFCVVYDDAKLARTAVALTMTVKMVSLCGYLFAFHRSRKDSSRVSKAESHHQIQIQLDEDCRL